jgi:arylamine N-acetyltransferase
MHAGEAWGINPIDAAMRIVRHGRGGYCYHLNGAFSELLHTLGYAVTRHVGGVHGPGGPSTEELGNHLVLTVGDLPSEENPSGTWYVDVGLGDAMHEALPLTAGAYEQAPFHLVLEQTDDGVGDWHLAHDPRGGFAGMSWMTSPGAMEQLAAKHEWLSTSPDSPFLKVAMAERRDSTGVDVIRGLILSRVGEGVTSSEPLTKRADWFAAFADMFGLRFDELAPEVLDRLWEGVLAKHEAWDASGRP